jgi:GNAT superfamily N-acetyltransferase
MNIAIRRASEFEAPLVSEILAEAATWLEHRGMPMWAPDDVSIRGVENDVNAGNFFLAWSDQVAVGTMCLTESDPLFWPDALPDEALYSHRLAIRRARSGGHVSSALLRWALDQARVRGVRYLRLDCEASRPSLRRIYERFGFSYHSDRAVGSFVVARYQISTTPPSDIKGGVQHKASTERC